MKKALSIFTASTVILVVLFSLSVAEAELSMSNEIISVDSNEAYFSASSSNPSLSRDGRYVVFSGGSSNSVYLRDRQTGTTEIVSIDSSGKEIFGYYPSISSDGRYVLFQDYYYSYLRDRQTGTTEIVSLTNSEQKASGLYPAMSSDARYIAFSSRDYYFRSGNSDYALCLRDRELGTTEVVTYEATYSSLSGDGRYLAYVKEEAGGGNDLFYYDVQNKTTTRIGCATPGYLGSPHNYRPAVSRDGRHIAFASQCTTTSDGSVTSSTSNSQIFVYDLGTEIVRAASLKNDGTAVSYPAPVNQAPSISEDGRYVSFITMARLIPEDISTYCDVYVRDMQEQRTEILSRSHEGQQQDPINALHIQRAPLSGDGRFVAFVSAATNIVPNYAGRMLGNVYTAGNLFAANQPPVADAGPDQKIICADPEGTSVILDGSGSYDLDGDELTYTWNIPEFGVVTGLTPIVSLLPGTYTIKLTVNDGKVSSLPEDVVVTIEADTTPPQLTISVSGIPGNNGWYRSPVDLTLTATDNCSVKEIQYSINDEQRTVEGDGSETLTANFTLSEDGIYKITATAMDMADLPSGVINPVIQIDRTPPIITITYPIDGGIYPLCNAPVPAHTVKDNLSGVCRNEIISDSCQGNTCLYTVIAEDCAGNSSGESITYTLEDTAPPVTIPEVNGTSGNNGWYTSAVSVSLKATDACPGVKEVRYMIDNGSEVIVPGDYALFSLTGDGEHLITYWAVDSVIPANIENRQTLIIKIDQTPPVITIEDVEDGGEYPLCAPPVPAHTVKDNLSGVCRNEIISDSCQGNICIYTVIAEDCAGNSATNSVSYKMIYSFGGFEPPVRPGDPFNQGRTIPVKFGLTDGCDNQVTTAAATLDLQKYSSCDVGGQPMGEPIAATSKVQTGKLFDFTGDKYIYNLSTDGLTEGAWSLIAVLDDGKVYNACIYIIRNKETKK